MENCTFCKIIKRELPGFIIDETDDIIVFLSLENHPLVVPKKHIVNIYSLDDVIGNLIMSEIIKISKAVKIGLECDGVYITQANEPAAGQDVFHIHFHIYPRWLDKTRNINKRINNSEKEMIVNKIKKTLTPTS